MSKRHGFTLLEVLISLIILSVGIIAIVRALSTGVFTFSNAENINLALNIAQAKMEEIKNTAYAGISDSSPTSDPVFPRFSVRVNVTEAAVPLEVEVLVNWNEKGTTDSVSLKTLVANY